MYGYVVMSVPIVGYVNLDVSLHIRILRDFLTQFKRCTPTGNSTWRDDCKIQIMTAMVES